MIPDILIARIEQEIGWSEELAQSICYEFEMDPVYPSIATLIHSAMVEGSVDAVISFIALKLPNWMPWLQWYPQGVEARLWPPMDQEGRKVTAFAATPARAFLAASLKALNRDEKAVAA